uniref:Extra response regulator n=1 Tax=Solanum tuberosum TaxID=4113 RepID=M1DE06_SOLTU
MNCAETKHVWREAKNGQEAVIAHHIGACFDLIMMDLDMSVMNGRQETMELRDMHVDSLIVGMTSREKEEEEKLFVDVGLDYYYQKPLTIDVVHDLVEKINGNA